MVERYNPSHENWGRIPMEPDTIGCYVRHSDYANLERQIAELRAELRTATDSRKFWKKAAEEENAKLEAAEAENARLSEALREYENPTNWGVNGRFDANSSRFDGTSFAHGILAALSGSDTQPAIPLKDEVERVLEGWQTECATEGCNKQATVHFERGGIGSYYCHDCYMRIQALPASTSVSEGGSRG
jgi:hypothetical protein